MPKRNVVRVPRHAIGVVKAVLFPSAIPSSNDLAASGINLGITTAKAKDSSSAATDFSIFARGGGGGSETAATPNKEEVVRNNNDNVEVDSEAAPDTSSAAAVHHAILRENFESVLDYLETKYVKSIMTPEEKEELDQLMMAADTQRGEPPSTATAAAVTPIPTAAAAAASVGELLPAEIEAVLDEIIPLVTDLEAHYANPPAQKKTTN